MKLNVDDITYEKTITRCTHCQTECSSPITIEQNSFCCQGCLSVYQFLRQNNLATNYYDLKKSGAKFRESFPVESVDQEYSYLLQEDFRSNYVKILPNNRQTMSFYIEGISCLACLWLLENLPQMQKGITHSKLTISTSLLLIEIDSNETNFKDVANLIAKLGHRPHPIKDDLELQELKRKNERSILTRIGVAAFGAGNIMVYSAGLYTGATEIHAKNFSYISLALAIPVLTYSAMPFYKTAIKSLKEKKASIDIPIALGLVMGFVASVFNIVTNTYDHYLDTLTTLVFLVLLSRYTLSKLLERGMNSDDATSFLAQGNYLTKREGEDFFSQRHSSTLRPNDLIQVAAGDTVPADAIILEGKSSIHNALLTGESTPLCVQVGDRVRHGAVNLDDTLTLKIEKCGAESVLGKMIEELRNSKSRAPKISLLSANAAKILIFAIPLLSISLIFSFMVMGQMKEGFDRAIALLVITCPCALGLSIPLTFSLGLRAAEKKGVLIKDEKTLEHITQVTDLAFDKTGTLTEGRMGLLEIELIHPPLLKLADIIVALEAESRHPIARSLCQAFREGHSNHSLLVQNRREGSTLGVSGIINQNFYDLKPTSSLGNEHKRISLYENGQLICILTLSDRLRSNTKELLSELKKYPINLHILSGDEDSIVRSQTKGLGIEDRNIHSELLPSDKEKIITSLQKVAMVGDGVNDASALKNALVGIAVKGGSDVSIRSADVYLSSAGLVPLLSLFDIAARCRRTLKTNIAFSFIYNSIAISAAVTGLVTPLWAAVFMPLSSLSSFAITTIMMRNRE